MFLSISWVYFLLLNSIRILLLKDNYLKGAVDKFSNVPTRTPCESIPKKRAFLQRTHCNYNDSIQPQNAVGAILKKEYK